MNVLFGFTSFKMVLRTMYFALIVNELSVSLLMKRGIFRCHTAMFIFLNLLRISWKCLLIGDARNYNHF